jgi:4-hydroxy-4-methyl-2-oxoglutarate aldolase
MLSLKNEVTLMDVRQDELSDLLPICREDLYTAVICDTLDSFGYRMQVLPRGLRPLDERLVLCGRARVGIFMPIFHDDATVNVYENEIRLIDDLKPGDVPVLVCHGNLEIAPWGELLTTRAKQLHAAGCLTDGCVRDVARIRAESFPVFCGGFNPSDTKYRGKLMWVDVPGKIGDVDIASGDLIFGDVDGIVIIPYPVARKVLTAALDKVNAENKVRDALLSGMSLAEAFEAHKVL